MPIEIPKFPLKFPFFEATDIDYRWKDFTEELMDFCVG